MKLMTLIYSLVLFCGVAQAQNKQVTQGSIVVDGKTYERSVFVNTISGELTYQYTDENLTSLNKKQFAARHPAKISRHEQPVFDEDLIDKLELAEPHKKFTVFVLLSRSGTVTKADPPNHAMLNENSTQRLKRRKMELEKSKAERGSHFKKLVEEASKLNQWNLGTTREKFTHEDVAFRLLDGGVAKITFTKEELIDVKENGAGIIRTVALVKSVGDQTVNEIIRK